MPMKRAVPRRRLSPSGGNSRTTPIGPCAITLMRSSAAISAFYHIDHALQVPGEVLAHVFLDHGKREARVAVEEPALVLGDDDVVHVPEGRILGQGLFCENVERGAGDPLFL